MRKLTPDTLNFVGSKFDKFCNILYDNCDSYIFYRGHIYSNSKGFICIDFLASDIDGVFKCPNLCYDPVEDRLYLSKKFKLLNERIVADALYDLILEVSSLDIPVSKIYFDQNIKGRYTSCYLEEDSEEVGSFIFYLRNERDCNSYQDMVKSYQEAVKVCGSILCCDWRRMLAEKEGANV